MVTLQDISIQLMKPAKDLADWKFPLSQILEEYYALLEEPCNINFGEAALVLQNSTNVYVRRIERLLNETEVLKQMFYGYEEDKMRKAIPKEKITFKKAYVDFENFVIIDIEKDIGKNIDKKGQYHIQKRVKLLSHRFTQLENNLAQLCIPIQVYDVFGDVIGNKYDFRCNQPINPSGMLVDELTPYDFTHTFSSYIQKGRNSLSSYSEPKTPGTGTSGYHSITSPNDNDFLAFNNEEFEDEHNSLVIENAPSVNEFEAVEENATYENTVPLSESVHMLSQAIIEKDTTEEHYNKRNAIQNVQQTFVPENLELVGEIKETYQNEHLLRLHQTLESTRDNDKEIVQFETNQHVRNYRQFNDTSKEHQVVKLDNVGWKDGLSSLRKRGNQTTKMSICCVDDINENDWKPMPLFQGKKHVFSHTSSTLKLPNYISVFETKICSKRRKHTSALHKPECLAKLILHETELFNKRNATLRTIQSFKHLQRRELEGFMRNLDECLNDIENENGNSRYEAVTNIAIDLLGFRISENQNSSNADNMGDMQSTASSPDITSQTSVCQTSDSLMAKSANSNNNWCESSMSEINLPYSLPDYQTLIEGKMKEIFEESNAATELDQTVAKWHASLQPKLSEAEIRPVFRIQDYASRIIRTLQTLDQKKINFDSVVRDKPACEVARYFLASLQLANTYNVEIKAANDDNSIEITLLEQERNFEKH